MKLTTLLLVAAILQVSASTFAQKITLAEKNTPLNKVFEKISDQTGYDFIVSTDILKLAKPVSVNVQNEDLKFALDKVFANQPLAFVIQDKMVVVTKKAFPLSNARREETIAFLDLNGKVTDSTGLALPGATIKIKSNSHVILTDQDGRFRLAANEGDELEISFVGYDTYSYIVHREVTTFIIVLHSSSSKLNEIQVIGYGTTTKRFNTGSVSTVTAKEIETQPVTNVLSALSGRVPGVFVQTTSGLPGGNINVQIRGKGSISAGTNPLFIIDGIPFESGAFGTTNINANSHSIADVVSPLNSINPSDIESISILRDADATAIYGSRGSNGVVLITMKKGKSGATKTSVSVNKGMSQVANQPNVLSLADYLQVRKEAFVNDNITPTINNAPDLLVWSQTQETDWLKYAFGNRAAYTDVQGSVSGGTDRITFNTSGSFHQEGNIISNKADYLRGGVHLSLNYRSLNKKFELQVSNSIVLDGNQSPNLANSTNQIVQLSPNFPLYDFTGVATLNSANPAKTLNAITKVQTNNIITSLSLSYAILSNLKFKISGGYNKINLNQQWLYPLIALNAGPNYSQFNENYNQSAIVEPQLNYTKSIGVGNLNLLVGGTYQNRLSSGKYLQVSNFSNEKLLEDFSSAGSVDERDFNYTHYKYVSLFGRLNYNLLGKYIFNATVRRDGSSRFGPGDQFGNFGSIGAAWLFSEEPFIRQLLPILSFGKLRSSFGTTGNDQITDYQFLSTSISSGRTYQGIATLKPSRISNADFHWETTKKFEVGLELGFLEDRILLDIDYYRNRSDDQLVNYNVPSLTGFTSYQANLPATIQNLGWEIVLTTANIKSAKFNWTTVINLTVPRNQLGNFENFSSSAFAQTLQIGYDITRVKGYNFLGVDPQTGAAQYGDINGNPASTAATRNTNYTIGKTTPNFYGGISNSISYKNFSLDFFFQFASQMSRGGILYSVGNLPINYYAYTVNRWQSPGMITNVPKSSTISDSNYGNSSANFFNSSYVRFKTLSFNYELPKKITDKVSAQRLSLFVRAENLMTFWNKDLPLSDPEAGASNGLTAETIAPVRTIATGINFTF